MPAIIKEPGSRLTESAFDSGFYTIADHCASAGNPHIIDFTCVLGHDLMTGCDYLHIGHAGFGAAQAGVAEVDGFIGQERDLLRCGTRQLGDEANRHAARCIC